MKPAMDAPGRPPTLNRLLLRLITLRLLVPLLLIGAAVFVAAGYLGEKRIEAEQHLLTYSTASLVERYLDHASRMLDAVARAAQVSTPAERALLLKTTLAAYTHFDTLYYLDKRNKITSMVPTQTRYLGLDMSNLPYFGQTGLLAPADGGVIISSPFISIRTGAPTVYLIKRLPAKGTVIGELSLASLQREIMGLKGRVANSIIYILDQSGMVLAHPSASMVRERTNLGNLEIFRRALAGDVSLVFNDGRRWMLGSADRIESGGWVVVTQVPLSAAFGPYAWTLVVLLLATFGIWAALSWHLRGQLRRHVVKPLERLSRLATALADGNYAENAAAAGAPATSAELDRLTTEFRSMSGALKEREALLRESEERYRSLFDRVPAGLFRSTPDGRIVDINPALQHIMGFTEREALLDFRIADIWVTPEERVKWAAAVEKDGIVRDYETQMRRRDGTLFWARLNARAIKGGGDQLLFFEGILEDISERKRAEEERTRLEEQLRQSQKMESVGLLAGGVAHDFNNLLTPILGYCDILIKGLAPADPRRIKLERIREAADSAKELIKRLLAFSRKQLIELLTVDMGDVIRGFENVLRRTIHENISIEVEISPSLGLVCADRGQLEVALLNLAINAQDAMPDGGTLTIEAREMDLDESYTSSHPEIAPGTYVMLAVSDTGSGMDKQTLEHIFEPFFTTKEMGRGTGLGLATVYGIVKQHGGSICVYSEPGMGSTFKIFLPRAAADARVVAERLPLNGEVERGSETIMVVEDNVMVRELAYEMLKQLGYKVVAAETPEQCMELMNELEFPISLLLTDVVMPNMNGRQLFERIRDLCPHTKVLFMSGYTSNVIGRHGVLDEGVQFIQKPFSIQVLSQKVRQVLDSRG
ncbi:MAG TPA: ATP-binding protein [Desulfuromonadaceae bacterium]